MSEWKETDIGFIPHNWESIKFTEILETTLRNGLNKPSRVRGGNGDYKLVNMNEIFAHDVIKDISMEFVELDAKEKSTSLLKKYDLLFARQSLVLEGAGKCSIYMGNDEKVCFESHIIRARLNLKKSNPQFYYYFFSSHYGKRFIKTITEQAVVAGIRGSDLKELKIPYPPKKQQDTAVAVLSCLDRKIENLRRQNETLEQIAQTLFKHWFVDFEFPNEDGKPYKLSGGAMERSELGKIPVDWRVGKLRDAVNVNAKSISNDYKHTNIEYVDISSVGIGNLEGTSLYYLKDAPSRARRLVTHGDVIWSGVRPNRKSYLFISHPPENLVISTGFITLTPILIPSSYLYSWVTTDSFVEYLTFNASGSAYPAVKAEHFEIADILLPEKAILNKFHSVVNPMREKIHQNTLHIKTLTKTRDVLLPQLMSGEVRITE